MTQRPLRPLKRRLSAKQAARRTRRLAKSLEKDPQRGYVHAFISKNMMKNRLVMGVKRFDLIMNRPEGV